MEPSLNDAYRNLLVKYAQLEAEIRQLRAQLQTASPAASPEMSKPESVLEED